MESIKKDRSKSQCKRIKNLTGSKSKSFSLSISPKSKARRLINQKIPKLRHNGFFLGINVNSSAVSPAKIHTPEKLPKIYLDDDSIYEAQYQELVDSILEKGNKSFQFERLHDLQDTKFEQDLSLNDIKVCGRFKKKLEIRTKVLLPQTLAKIKLGKPHQTTKLNIGGISALGYQKIITKDSKLKK